MIGDLYTFKGRTVRVLKRWGKPDPPNPVLERGWRGGDLIDGEYRPKPRKKKQPPRNVEVEDILTGERFTRPFRGMRKAEVTRDDKAELEAQGFTTI